MALPDTARANEGHAMATSRQRREAPRAGRLRFRRLLSDLSARFSNLSSVDLDRQVNCALRGITTFVGVQRATLVEFPERGGPGRCWSTNEALQNGRFPWLTRQVQGGKPVRILRLQQLPRDADVDRASCRALGITAQAAVPLWAGGKVVGGLTMAAKSRDRGWSNEIMEQLHLLGEVLGNALAAAKTQRETGRLRQELAHIGRVSALGELTASLAHELSQPLTAILNNAEVARRYLDADVVNRDELRAILDDIVADDRRAAEVIRRLRALLKKGDLEHVTLDVNDFVGEVAQLVRKDALRRNVSMTLDLGSELPRVRGDRVQLQQVVLNMVLNGLEAMGEPNGRPHGLILRTSGLDRTTVTVAIADTGTGIDVADIGRMAQPLYTTKAEGLGMGLAISRRIIDAHGGSLSASNNPEGGATFAFTLPVDGAP
jgi:signal transduction histidine kinase